MHTQEPGAHAFDAIKKALWNELVTAQTGWDEYRTLFRHSQERVELLNQSARWFFGEVQRLMIREIILAISRLTDPSRTGQRKNLSLSVLLADPRLTEHDGLLEELTSAIDALRTKAEPIRHHRNKQIGHLDHAVALGEPDAKLPKLPWDLFSDVLKEMQRIYNLHGQKVYQTYTFFEVSLAGGSEKLARLLEVGNAAMREQIKRRSLTRGN